MCYFNHFYRFQTGLMFAMLKQILIICDNTCSTMNSEERVIRVYHQNGVETNKLLECKMS